MIISIIVAMDEKGGIAWRGGLPWHLSAEMNLFRQTTLGHHILMGRKTFESIGKPLPGRINIVISHRQNYHLEGCVVVNCLEDGFAVARSNNERELFVCGGENIYSQTIPLADRIYLTVVHTIATTDMVFPPFDKQNWEEIDTYHHPADDKNPFAFTRKILTKIPVTKVDKP